MQRFRPLPDTYPEFSVLERPNFREYRVENWHLSRDGSKKTIRMTSGLGWKDAVFIVVLSLIGHQVRGHTLNICAFGLRELDARANRTCLLWRF
jgi:phosphatidylinositol glycan class H protein